MRKIKAYNFFFIFENIKNNEQKTKKKNYIFNNNNKYKNFFFNISKNYV